MSLYLVNLKLIFTTEILLEQFKKYLEIYLEKFVIAIKILLHLTLKLSIKMLLLFCKKIF